MDGMIKQCKKQDKSWLLSSSSDLAWYSSNFKTVSLLLFEVTQHHNNLRKNIDKLFM